MLTLNAHFDGKVIVPDEPLDLTPNQKLRISIEPLEPPPLRPHSDWQSLIGLGLPVPENHQPRFSSNDDLWETNK